MKVSYLLALLIIILNSDVLRQTDHTRRLTKNYSKRCWLPIEKIWR